MFDDDLARVPLFDGLSRDELARIAECCLERGYAAGAVLVRQGEQGVGLFIVASGSVRVTQHQEDGEEQLLALLGPGGVFGEMALLDDLPRSATVTALEPTRTLVLVYWDFRAMLLDNAEIAVKLLGVLSRRLRAAEQRPL
jgi:CRP/FNR family transcriptional regulator